jgi:hypothetical protein
MPVSYLMFYLKPSFYLIKDRNGTERAIGNRGFYAGGAELCSTKGDR